MKKITLALALSLLPLTGHAFATTSVPWIATSTSFIQPNRINGSDPVINVASTTGTSTFAGSVTVNRSVGIGTTTPGTKLTLANDTTIAGGLGLGSDVALYRSGTNQLSLALGGLERMRWAVNANSGQFQMVGNGNASAPKYSWRDGDSNTGMYLEAADTLAFATDGENRLTIGATGNVGIRTTTPDRTLNVNGNATFGMIGASTATSNPLNVSFGSTYGNNTPGNVRNLKWDMFTNNTSGTRYGIGMSSNLMEYQAGLSGQHAFFVNQGTEAMRITSTGLVGVGTTTPDGKMTVYKTGSGSSSVGLTVHDAVLPTYSANADNLFTVRGTGSSATTWRGRVTAGGDNRAFIMGEYNSQAWLGAHTANLAAWADLYINPDGTTQSTYIGDMGGGAASPLPILTVSNALGNVGIGTTSPIAKLSVAGNAIITGTTTPIGRLILPMGEAYYFDSTGTTIAIAGVSDGLSNMVLSNPSTSLSMGSHEFTDGSGRMTYTGSTTKMFHAAMTMSVSPTLANDTIVIALAKNGTVIQSSRVIQRLGTTLDVQALSFHSMVELATSDYVEIYVGNMTGADDFVVNTQNMFLLGN